MDNLHDIHMLLFLNHKNKYKHYKKIDKRPIDSKKYKEE